MATSVCTNWFCAFSPPHSTAVPVSLLSYVRFVKVTVLCLSFMQWVCFKQCTLNSNCPNKAWKRNLWIVLLIKIAKIFCLCLELSGYGRYLPESAAKDQVKYTVCYLLHIGFILRYVQYLRILSIMSWWLMTLLHDVM